MWVQSAAPRCCLHTSLKSTAKPVRERNAAWLGWTPGPRCGAMALPLLLNLNGSASRNAWPAGSLTTKSPLNLSGGEPCSSPARTLPLVATPRRSSLSSSPRPLTESAVLETFLTRLEGDTIKEIQLEDFGAGNVPSGPRFRSSYPRANAGIRGRNWATWF
jgi:hypothetical protein